MKQELAEDQTATAEYRERMAEAAGLEPIEVDEEEGGGVDYREVVRRRKQYLDKVDKGEIGEGDPDPVYKKKRGDPGYVSVSEEEDEGFESGKEEREENPDADLREAHYTRMKQEQPDSDEDDHDPDRPARKREDYSWGGPEAGDDRDEGFLIDEQAGRRRTRGSEEDDPENPESYLNAPTSNRRARPDKTYPPLLRGRRQLEEAEETAAEIQERNYTDWDVQRYRNPFEAGRRRIV